MLYGIQINYNAPDLSLGHKYLSQSPRLSSSNQVRQVSASNVGSIAYRILQTLSKP